MAARVGLPTAAGKRASAARWPCRSGGLEKEKTAPLPGRTLSGAVSVSRRGPVAQPGAPPGPATGWGVRLAVATTFAAGEPELTGTRSRAWRRTPTGWVRRVT